MEDEREIPDSTFLNFQRTISDIERAQNRSNSKKRGVRGDDNLDVNTLAANLKKDMLSIITSPLSQSQGLQPIPGLSADGIQALRSLHSMLETMVKEGRDLDKETNLEAMVNAAVRLLRDPNLKPEAEEEAAEELDGSSAAGLSGREARRSNRLAQLAKKSYDDNAFDEDEFGLEAEEVEGSERAQSEDVDMVDTEREEPVEPEVGQAEE